MPSPVADDVTPEYLGGGVLCLRHVPAAPGAPTGVVLVPPLGWEEVASYRARRRWAQRLAAAGHHVIRLDLPGTGDSAGAPGDPGRLEAWSTAVGVAAARLRAVGATRVAVIGLGLGGLPAALAASGEAPVDDLVLWATPERGGAAVRRLRALARLQSGRALMAGEEPTAAPGGGLEVDGFVLAAELLGGLGAVELASLDYGGLQRALLLPADGAAVDAALRERLLAAGVAVDEVPGGDYDAMVADPEHVTVPEATVAVVSAWLSAGAVPSARPAAPVTAAARLEVDPSRASARPAAPVAAAARLEVDPSSGADGSGVGAGLATSGGAELGASGAPGGVRETPLWIQRPAGRLFAVLTEPAQRRGELCAVLLNGGAVRHAGPNRMWVEAARRWAAEGVPTLRLDVPGVGESDGDEALLQRVATMYAEGIQEDVRAALDELAGRGVASRFVLAGLCSGAYHAFQAAVRDERVAAVGMLNPRALVWEDDLAGRQEAGRLRSVASAEQWRRLLSGHIGPGTIWTSVRAAWQVLGRRLRQVGEPPAAAAPVGVEAQLRALTARGVTVVLGLSGGEPLEAELRAQDLLTASGLELTTLPSRDHGLRPLSAQRAGHALLDRALAAGATPSLRAPRGPSW